MLCVRTRVSTVSRCAPLIMAIALFSVLDTAHGADIYRWKDDNNVTTFSQLPPVEGVYVERLLRRGRTAANAFSATSAADNWRAVLPDAAIVERTHGIEHSGIRPAETPAEQELNERLDALSEISALVQAPRRTLQSRWTETHTRPQPSKRR